jgi:hypothetical protein
VPDEAIRRRDSDGPRRLLPSTVAAQAPTQDAVTGEFTTIRPGGPPLEFFIDAHSGPSGENPGGTFVAAPNSNGATPYSVVCLKVTGKTAVIGVDQVSGDFNAFLRVEDAAVDTLAVAFWSFPLSAGSCGLPGLPFSAPETVLAGDIVVTDTSPVPTSKDQCKNGGWRTFPGFKNQGDCVSFVATGGKNPPANSP